MGFPFLTVKIFFLFVRAGWLLQLSGFVCIAQDWRNDEARLKTQIDALAADSAPLHILHLPEGAALEDVAAQKKSNAFEVKTSSKHLQHLLQPRTTGFGFIAERLRDCGKLDAVYDVTVAYEADNHSPKSLKDVPFGEGPMPGEVHFCIRRSV